MLNKELIAANEFCVHHNIEFSFINSLQNYGLIEMTIIEGNEFISLNQLSELEKFIRLHYELNINLEGIDAIHNLLQRMNDLHNELFTLRNRLRLYEAGEY